ncbi:MAG: extracellular solute-binding protein [Candidatus Atribacteria bacterium]|nr:extracellular solute-binding protein [Candidatus Atribacteria bacterium]
MKRIKKQTFFSVLIIIASFLIASCANPKPVTHVNQESSEKESVEEPITLTVWWWGEPEAPGTGKWLKDRADEYTEENPNVVFELVEQNIDTVVTAFKAAAAAKSGPDIAFLFSGGVYVMEDVWEGNIVPISDYATEEQMSTWIDTFSKTYDGKIWTMPFYMQSYLMMYNKDLFTKAGLDPENPPSTMDELLNACEILNRSGIAPMASGMRDLFQGGIYYSELGVQSLPDAYSIQRATIGEESFEDRQHAEWLEALDQMVKASCFNEDVNSLDLYSGWEVFGRGEAAMLQANDAFLPVAIENLGEENVGLMRMPSYTESPVSESMCYFSQGLGITSWSPYKEVAADFLLTLHAKENVDEFYKITSIPFANTNFDTSLIKSELQKEEFEWISERPQLCPEGLTAIQIWETGVMPASQAIFQQSLSPAEAAQLIEDVARNWRESNPPNFDNWITWAKPGE